jgi:hypothetical protein
MATKEKNDTILQECLEILQQGQEDVETILERYPQQADWLRPELLAWQWLEQKRQAFEPRTGFVKASRPRLEARLIHRPSRWPVAVPWSFEIRRRWISACLLLVLLFQVGLIGVKLAQAAPAWLPGDFLYPLKTAYEEAGLLFNISRAGDARLHIQFVGQRLLEMQALMVEGRYDEVKGVAANFEFHVTQAVILVEALDKHNPEQARILARELKSTLVEQAGLLRLLALFVPINTQEQCERVRSISVSGIFAVQDILGPNGMHINPVAYSFVRK